MIRRLAMVAALASAAVTALPAPPASAWTGAPCRTSPQTPSLDDPQLTFVSGSNAAQCNPGIEWDMVTSEARLYMYSTAATGWEEVAQQLRAAPDSDYAYAAAFFDCKGLGQRGFYTKGRALAADGASHTETDWAKSTYTTINCGQPPPVPLIGH